MNTWKRLAALLGAGALGLAAAGTTLALDDWATVTGHEAFSSDANHEDYWGDNCSKIDTGEGDLGEEQHTYVLSANYGLVVVKSGSGEFANTLFGDSPSAGQTVWADTNGNSVFDEGDHAIGHIIFCDEEQPSEPPVTEPPVTEPPVTEPPVTEPPVTEPPVTEPPVEPSFEQSVAAITDPPSLPDTSAVLGPQSAPSADMTWLLVVALGAILGTVVVLTPAPARRRR